MTIMTNSRYLGDDQVLVQIEDGSRHFAIYPEQFVAFQARYIEHVAVEGETFDNIAFEIYGDPTLWWVVARLNPHVFFPDRIPAGTFLRKPIP